MELNWGTDVTRQKPVVTAAARMATLAVNAKSQDAAELYVDAMIDELFHRG